ncbi:MAG: ATP-binding cassette domain-containing protein [Chitinophagaceae bacterium]
MRDVHLTLQGPGSYALLGVNGSGKSTLLRIIAGIQQASKGTVEYSFDGHRIAPELVFRHVDFCAPGMDIIEEMSLREFLQFHFRFKQPLKGITIDDIIALIGIRQAGDKLIGDFSSGMKQRVKLAQAIFSDTQALFLDEPCTNLDDKGVDPIPELDATVRSGATRGSCIQ